MKKIVGFFFIIFSLSGCQILQNLSNQVSKPSLSISDVHITGFNFNEMELTYDVAVDNPNSVALKMLSYDYDLNINDHDFISGDEVKKINIEADGKSTFQIPMKLNFKELYNLFGSLKGKDEASYNLLADLDFDIPVLGKTTLPLKQSGSLPMLKLPKISVANIKVKDLSFTKADLMLNMNVQNPNGFGLLINSMAYNLNVNGMNWVDGRNAPDLKIGQKDSQHIGIPISLNIAQIGASVFQLINNKDDVNFKLKGNFDFGATHPLLKRLVTNFKFDESGKVPFIR